MRGLKAILLRWLRGCHGPAAAWLAFGLLADYVSTSMGHAAGKREWVRLRRHLGILAFLLSGCAIPGVDNRHPIRLQPDQYPQQDNARWLNASQQMLSVGDPAISTTDPQKVLTLVEWAATNGYTVQVSQRDPVAGERRGMFFMVVTKR